MKAVLVYRGRYPTRAALDLEVLAPVLRRAGHEVALVYDPDCFGSTDNVFQVPTLARRLSDPERTAARVLAERPDVVLVSALPATGGWCRELATAVRAGSEVPIVLHGLLPTLLPERCLDAPAVDAVVQGEVEGVVGPLLEALASGGPLDGIANLWSRDRAGRVVGAPRAPAVDLDELPPPDKGLFWPWVSSHYSYVALASRGCALRCSYCEETCVAAVQGRGFHRRRSVDSVIGELVAARDRLGFREVLFKDSCLVGDRAWLAALMARYRREVGLPFKCFANVVSFDDEVARMLRDGGCYGVELGLQTWNEDLRRRVLRRPERDDQVRAAFAACARQGLWFDVDHLFDLPGESADDHRRGAREYRRLPRLNRVKVHRLAYLPGAPIVEAGLASGAISASELARVEAGDGADVYDGRSGSEVDGWSTLYKVLPALPEPALEWLLEGGNLRSLGRVPAPAVAALQTVLAVRSRDRRFAAWLGLYPRKLALSAVESLPEPARAAIHARIAARRSGVGGWE